MLLQIVWLCCIATTILCSETDNIPEEHWEYLGIAVEPDYIILVPHKNCKPGERRDFFGNCRTVINSSTSIKKNNPKENEKSPSAQEYKGKLTSASASTPKKSVAEPLPVAIQGQKSLKPLKSIIFPNITVNISEITVEGLGDLHIPAANLTNINTHKINLSSVLIPQVNLSLVNTSAINMYNISLPVINSVGTKTFEINLPVINASSVNISDIGLPVV